ncbi:alpha-beta hydrolase superfamily lysophospholipase [Rhodococcus sp. 27YEA15]|uniref:alpha/beta hydrolase n=1 Tax=Rhodococcus sp. 27YEA15 TaxID=3156259 RepID=UPI003C79A3EA
MSTDWLNPEANARGSVIVIAGRGEHADVYGRFARRIAFDGYRVAVVENDADAVEHAIEDAAGDVPLTVIGSDTGALAALDAAARYSAVDGVVAAGLLVTGTDTLTSDWERELEIRSACPVHRGVLTSVGALDPGHLGDAATVATTESLTRVTVPTLVVHGSADQLSPAAEVLALVAELPDTQIAVVHEGRHDILNDVSHRSVAAAVVEFLERLRLPGRPVVVVRDPAVALSL